MVPGLIFFFVNTYKLHPLLICAFVRSTRCPANLHNVQPMRALVSLYTGNKIKSLKMKQYFLYFLHIYKDGKHESICQK